MRNKKTGDFPRTGKSPVFYTGGAERIPAAASCHASLVFPKNASST